MVYNINIQILCTHHTNLWLEIPKLSKLRVYLNQQTTNEISRPSNYRIPFKLPTTMQNVENDKIQVVNPNIPNQIIDSPSDKNNVQIIYSFIQKYI